MAAFPTAHTFAHLRIAGRVTASVARLATGWVGAPFAGRGSHPLDDEPNFMTSSQPHSFRTSLAWSHWKSLLADERVSRSSKILDFSLRHQLDAGVERIDRAFAFGLLSSLRAMALAYLSLRQGADS